MAVLRLQQVVVASQDLPQRGADSGVLRRQQQGISGSHRASLPSPGMETTAAGREAA